MSNLAQLFQVAPITAAGFTGTQVANDEVQSRLGQQKTLADITKMQQEMEYNTQANPLRLRGLELANEGTSLTNTGLGHTNRKLGVDADIAEQTKGGKIEVENSGNTLKLLQDRMKRIDVMDDFFTRAAAETQSLGPIQRAMALRQMAEEANLDVNDPKVIRMLQHGTQNPQSFLRGKQQAAEARARMQQSYIEATMKEQEAFRRQKYASDRSLEGTKYTANQRVAAAQAKAQAVKLNVIQQVQTGKLKANEVPMAFRAAARMEQDPELRNWLMSEAAMAEQALLHRGNARAQPGIDENGNLVRETPPNVYDDGNKPPLGTKENPIKLD